MASFYPQIENPEAPVKCGNCSWEGKAEDLEPIQSAQQRLTAGETVPAGECPSDECGALAYLIEPPRRVLIVLDGGLVQDIVTDYPHSLGIDCAVIDYDTEGLEDSDMLHIEQSDGGTAEARGYDAGISRARIDLGKVWAELDRRDKEHMRAEIDRRGLEAWRDPADLKPGAPVKFEGLGLYHWEKVGFRPPRQGEYYLSGAIVEAWQAPNDLPTDYHVIKPTKPAAPVYSVCFDIGGDAEGKEYASPEEAAEDVAQYVRNVLETGNPEDHCITLGRE